MILDNKVFFVANVSELLVYGGGYTVFACCNGLLSEREGL